MNNPNQTVENLQRLITNHQRRLQKLKETQALQGYNTPPDVLLEIEDIEETIQELQTSLTKVELDLKNNVSLDSWHQPKPGRSLEILLRIDFQSFPLYSLQDAIEAFAGAMQISPGEIQIDRICFGSIIFELRVIPEGIENFRSRLQSNSAQLRLLKVEKAVLEVGLYQREEWVFQEGRFIMTETTNNKPIGRTSATERDPSTSDKFCFWLPDEVIVNPFDIVKVDQVNQPGEPESQTYGLVTTLEHRTDAANHLSNYISSNFGEIDEEPNTPRHGTTVAFVNVLSNNADIYMPVPSDRPVFFADKEGIEEALGIDQMDKDDRIPAGLIKMSNGVASAAYLDRKFVLGPESAHVNISGISGLATKTSYAMFLLQSILQTASDPDDIAVIILNVKQGDLLRIDERGPSLDPDQMEMWEALGLEPQPFKNVHYLLPRRDKSGLPNSFIVPNMYTIYAYDLDYTADKLDLLFTNVSDPTNTMESIIGDIMQGLEGQGDSNLKNVHSWNNLLYSLPLFDSKERKSKGFGDNKSSSVGKFRRQLRRLVETRQSGIFVDSRAQNEKNLGYEITNLKGGHVYVVDIAKLRDEEQTLVFGDLLRTVYELKAEEVENRTEKSDVPGKIIFFVDELNKYAPSGSKESPITQQVLDIAERGRSLGVILISAQQFMSVVHNRVTGNSASKILGRSGAAEVMAPDYRFLDNDLKMSITRLGKGELLVSHAVYRQPVKIIFPKPAYKQEQF